MTAPTPAHRAAAEAFIRAHLDPRWQGWLVEPLAAWLATHAAPTPAAGLPELPPDAALTDARRRLGQTLSAHGSSWGHVDDMIRVALAAFDDGVRAAQAAQRAADAGELDAARREARGTNAAAISQLADASRRWAAAETRAQALCEALDALCRPAWLTDIPGEAWQHARRLLAAGPPAAECVLCARDGGHACACDPQPAAEPGA